MDKSQDISCDPDDELMSLERVLKFDTVMVSQSGGSGCCVKAICDKKAGNLGGRVLLLETKKAIGIPEVAKKVLVS